MAVYIGEPPREREGPRHGLIAAGLVVLAFITHVLPPGAQSLIASGVRSSVLAPFLWTHERIARARIQATEAVDLQAEVDSLTSEVLLRASLSEENRRLRALLGLRARTGQELEAATVIRSGTPGAESVFLLDKGRVDGVEPGAAVLVASGLVGQVRTVAETSSTGIDWTHPDFRAGAMTEDGVIYGIVEPVSGGFREDDRLLFNGAPYSADIPPGTPIVASGRGGVYPRGLPIGIVDTLAQEDDGWRRAYWLRPVVNPASVTHALVVRFEGEGRRTGVPRDWWLIDETQEENPFDSLIVRDLPTVSDTPFPFVDSSIVQPPRPDTSGLEDLDDTDSGGGGP